MTAATIEAHGEPWTEEAYFALGETRDRIELFDGSLIVTPAPDVPHQQVARRLANALESHAEPELEVAEAVNIRLQTGRIFIPDVVALADPEFVTPAERVLLVGEVASPSNAGHDRVLNFHLYAEAGIPWYLLVEPDGDTLTLTLYHLADGKYVEQAVATGGAPLTIAEPIEVTIDPARLLRR